MTVTQPLPNSRETLSLNDRIVELASSGLKPRDISSMLGVHPMIVVRVLAEREVPHA